jgi:5-hydroxyisourate hydrolase-like protein (transthyretin family)
MFTSTCLLANELPYNQDEPISSRMSLTVTQLNGDSYEISALVRASINNRYVGLEGLQVSFYTYNEDENNDLEIAITNNKGIATIIVEDNKVLADTSNLVGFGVIFDGNDEFESSDDELEILKASMNIETNEEVDDEEVKTRTVEVTCTANGDPIEEATVYLYVKSMIRPLLIGEEETDEDGMVSFEFPTDLPGNSDGTIDFYSFIEDDADFGNVKGTVNKDWGTPRIENNTKVVRSLSSPNPPLWLLITFIGLLVIIWGHYIEVIIRLFKLKKFKN